MSTPRRRFLKSLAVAPLLPAAFAEPQTAPSPAPIPSPAPSPADVPGPVAEALTEVVRQRYGAQLEAEDLDKIKRAIDRKQKAAEALKKLKLGNGDEPVGTFRARPPGGSNTARPEAAGARRA